MNCIRIRIQWCGDADEDWVMHFTYTGGVLNDVNFVSFK